MGVSQISVQSEGANVQASLAGRYALALFSLSLECDKLAEVRQDISQIQAALSEVSYLKATLSSPLLKPSSASQLLTALVQALSLGGLSEKFLNVLAQNKRLNALEAICAAFQKQAALSVGEVEANVTTAFPLETHQRAALIQRLENITAKKITLHEIIDLNILGGIKIKLGSQMIDESIATKLNTLATAMKG